MSRRFLMTTVQTAIKNLQISPLRTTLALSGIAIGCAAIVSMLQIGFIAERQIMEQLDRAGAQLMVIEPNQESERIALPPEDVDLEVVLRAFPEIADAAFVQSYQTQITIDGRETYVEIIEAGNAFTRMANLKMKRGTLASLDHDTAAIAISASEIKSFDGNDLVSKPGDIVRIGFDGYRVAGTLRHHEYNSMIGVDMSRTLIVPRQSLKRLTREVDGWRIILQLTPDVPKDEIQKVLIERFRNDYGLSINAVHAENLIRAEKGQKRSLTFLLAAMGSVTLFVGTVGVANVMLASVAERRKEIGLRMAIGASPHDIMLLFLIEATVLCLLGGVVGACLGVIASNLYANLSAADFVVSYPVIALGLAVSALGGIAAGFYPAHQSSLLDPVKALQSE